MKKLYKEVSGKKLLKMFYKGTIKEKIILIGTEDNHYGIFDDHGDHILVNYKLSIDDLLNENNHFAIYKLNYDNLMMLQKHLKKEDNKYFEERIRG